MEIKLTNVFFLNGKRLLKLMMRTFIFLFCATVFSITPESALSQNTKISIDEDKIVTVDEVFKIIKEQTHDYMFIYSEDIFKDFPKVQLKRGIIRLDKLLNQSLSGGNVNIVLTQNNTILIKEIKTVQQIQVSGKVTDLAGLPVPGVTILIKGTSKGTVTDLEGSYTLTVPNPENVLVFSYLGYETQEITVGNQNIINVTFKEKFDTLNEVLVVGYGTTTRRNNTGAVSSVSSQVIESQVVDNPINAMIGRMAGVNISPNNGLPGSNYTVQIRGNNTLGGNGLSGALPLYIIDGVPFTNYNGSIPARDDLNVWGISGANGGLSPLSAINPDDILRIDVLKDGDATAIYGARAANGVVMITTKGGETGKGRLSVDYSNGWGEVGNFVKLLNTEQYLEMRREAFQNDGSTPNTSNAPDLTVWDQNAYTDFQDLLIGGRADISSLQLNYSGGNESTRYYMSGFYNENGTVFPGNMGSNRVGGRINVQTNSKNQKFKGNFNVSYSKDHTNLITTDITGAIGFAPNFPIYNSDGSFNWATGSNPLAYLKQKYQSDTENFIFSSNLQYDIFKDLHAKVNFGYTRSWLDQRSQNPASAQNPSGAVNNQARFVKSTTDNIIIEPQLEYNYTFSQGSVDALIGTTFQDYISETTSLTGQNYAYEDLLDVISAAGTISATNNYSQYKFASLFGRLKFGFRSKYIANVTYRRDASSRFGPNNRFANFGAVGLAWIFSNEKFLLNKESFFNYGKLNISYGLTGNDQIPDYQYLTLFSAAGGANANYEQITTLNSGTIGNPDLKWENTKKLDIGLDLGFFNNRILFKANYYRNLSTDLLTYSTIPVQSGVNSINANMDAEIVNRGLEFELTTVNISTDNFEWNSAFNITFQESELKRFDDIDQSFYGSSFEIGKSVTNPRYFSYGGVDVNTGDPIINDLDGTPGIDFNKDRSFVDIGTPFFGGLNNTIKYKNLTLNIFAQFNHRKGINNYLRGNSLGGLNNQNISTVDRWRNPGDTNVLWPGATTFSYPFFYRSSDFFYGDASFIKIRSVNLEYRLEPEWLKGTGIDFASIYFQGQNLLTFSKNSDYEFDPETGINSMPQLRTIVLGVKCTF